MEAVILPTMFKPWNVVDAAESEFVDICVDAQFFDHFVISDRLPVSH